MLNRMFYFFFFSSLALNIAALVFTYTKKGLFLIGDVMTIIITIINVCAYTIKRCIFERAISKDEQYITLYWCCCLTIGQKPVHKRKKKKMASSTIMSGGTTKPGSRSASMSGSGLQLSISSYSNTMVRE